VSHHIVLLLVFWCFRPCRGIQRWPRRKP
jgi:hypothetical protein